MKGARLKAGNETAVRHLAAPDGGKRRATSYQVVSAERISSRYSSSATLLYVL